MIKRMILMLLVVGLVLGGVFGFQVFKGQMIRKYMAAGAAPAQTVATVKAEAQDWQPALKAVGSLRAAQGVDVAPEVPGTVESLPFGSSTDVAQGAVLLQLHAEDDKARLEALEATSRLADIVVERDKKQLKAQAVSQATFDADMAAADVAKAEVNAQRALLAKKTILAPFAGRVGIRSVDVGQYLNAGTVVVTLQQLDPLYLDFTLPQQALPQLQIGQKVVARSDVYPDKAFDGTITAINAKVDVATRNVQIRATFANPDPTLLPGMFATVTVPSGAPQHWVTLPQTAIVYNPYGNTVYRVEEKGKKDKGEPILTATQAFVTTGETRGDQIAVLSGVKDGDQVVSAGQMKLHNGATVVVNNNAQPSNEAAPKVEDK